MTTDAPTASSATGTGARPARNRAPWQIAADSDECFWDGLGSDLLGGPCAGPLYLWTFETAAAPTSLCATHTAWLRSNVHQIRDDFTIRTLETTDA